MKKLWKRIRGNEDPGEFYPWHCGFLFLLFFGMVVVIFGRGELKLAGAFTVILSLAFLIVPHIGADKARP